MKNLDQYIPEDFPTKIIKIEKEEENIINFTLEVDCESSDFELWKEKFELLTSTNYTVRKSSKDGRFFLRTLYATCHHQTYGVVTQKYGSKNTECPSKLTMKRHKPLLVGQKTFTEIVVNFKHNHELCTADALRFRKPLDSTMEKFKSLFETGHSPSTAIQANIMDIILKYGDNYDVKLADSSICPNYQWVSRLYRKQTDKNYGNRNLSTKQQGELILKLAKEKDCEAKLVEVENQVSVIIITNLMKRVSQMEEAADICFIDSSGNVDKEGTRFFILLAKCHAGGVPLGVIFTTSECESLLTVAFQTFQETLPPNCFGGRSSAGPRIIMTDDSTSERNALKTVWPQSILLLCIFHVLQALWRWLYDAKHKITLTDRRYLLKLVQKILYADSESELKETYNFLLKDPVVLKYSNFVGHIKSLYERRREWALCYRTELLVRGSNTNNICESAMMIMKDIILQRVKAYNMVQLADFVICRLDLYYEQKILNIAFNRLSRPKVTQAFLERNTEFAKDSITSISENVFLVPSENDSNKNYIVNMELACCECKVGVDGSLCKHQVAVMKYTGHECKTILPVEDPYKKKFLYYIATGKDMDVTFFLSLRNQKENLKEKNESSKTEINCVPVILETNEDQYAVNCPMETDESEVKAVEKELKEVVDTLLNNLKDKQDVYLPAVRKFCQRYKSFNTDSNIISALHNFGSTLNESNRSASVKSLVRRGKKIKVQPTTIARRKQMQLGKGSTSFANTGRPRKNQILDEHKYTSFYKGSKAPHNLSICVKSNRSLGKSH